MFLISNAHAQTAPVAGGTAGSPMSFLPIILVLVVLWFIMIRPQVKRQKGAKAILEVLTKDGEAVIAGGILGKVSKVAEQYVTVETAANIEIIMQKGAVTTVSPKNTLKVL